MSAVKTVVWVSVAWVVIGPVARADAIYTSANGGTWVYFGKGSGNSSLDNVAGTSPPSAMPSPSNSPTPTDTNILATSPVFASSSASAPSASAPMTTANSSSILSSTPTADAFLNFGTSGYLESSQLTVGNPQPWYTSSSVTKFYNGQTPDAHQQADFTNTVLQDVKQTFSLAGMHPNITTDPTVAANHTLSVVSGASYGPNANAIGITDVGQSGFGFIDKFGFASNLTDLEWAVAHNISHELMHAFGVGYHPDQSGQYIDAGVATWSLLTNPSSTFSPAAVAAINANQNGATTTGAATGAQQIDGDQEILYPVPEPTTVALWGIGVAGGLFYHRRRRLTAA